jgi:hypothetical protein
VVNPVILHLNYKFTGMTVRHLTTKLSKGNLIAASDLGNVPILVVTPSADDYPLSGKVRVCSMKTLKENLQAFLVEI